MPGLITIPEFVREAREDFNSPTTSTFCNRIPHCRDTINRYDEVCIFFHVSHTQSAPSSPKKKCFLYKYLFHIFL